MFFSDVSTINEVSLLTCKTVLFRSMYILLHDVPPKSMAQNVEQTSESVIAEMCSYISGKVGRVHGDVPMNN